MFNNWLQAIFSSILTITFASIVMMGAIRFINLIFTEMVDQASESNLMTMGLMACVAGVVAGALVVLLLKAAGQIAGVSVNAAVQGMAMVGNGHWYGDVAVKGAIWSNMSGTKGLIHGSYEGGIGRKLDEKKSRGGAAMAGYGSARGNPFCGAEDSAMTPKVTGMIANHLLWIVGIGGVVFYGAIFYWINHVVKKIEVKYSKRRVCLFLFFLLL